MGKELFLVEDAEVDPRFCDNPVVSGNLGIRFYAGWPIEMSEGLVAGSLCILDTRPRTFASGDLALLGSLAKIASTLVMQHRSARRNAALTDAVEAKSEVIVSQSEGLMVQKRLLDCASQLARIGAWEVDCATGELVWSDGMYDLHEVPRDYDLSPEGLSAFYPGGEYMRLPRIIEKAKTANVPYTFEGKMKTGKGRMRWVRVAGHVEMRNGVAVRRLG